MSNQFSNRDSIVTCNNIVVAGKVDILDKNKGDLESTGLHNILEEINMVSEGVNKSGKSENAMSAAKEAHDFVASEQEAKAKSQTDSDAETAKVESATLASATKIDEATQIIADTAAPYDTNTDTAHDVNLDIDVDIDTDIDADGISNDTNMIKSHPAEDSQEEDAEVWNLFMDNEANYSPEEEKRDLIESKARTSKRSQKFIERPFILEQKAIRLEKKAMEEAEVNKVAKLATPLAKLKYKFPKPENEAKEEDMCLKDNRTVLEVYGDVIGR